MKYIIVVLLSLIPYLTKNETFQDKVLTPLNDRHSYYLTFTISSSTYKGDVVIENGDLFYYFFKTKKMGRTKYVEFMRNILSNNKIVYLNTVDFEKWSFFKVKFNNVIFTDAKRGKNEFISKYFKKGYLSAGYSFDDKAFIISLLFKWKIAAKIDCESGYLFIDR